MKDRLARLKIWRQVNKKYGFKGLIVLAVIAVALLATTGGVVRALLLGPANGNNTVDLSKGLVAWWKMSGNSKDSTPNNNNLIATGSPSLSTDREGMANSSYNFNSSSQYFSTPASPVLSSSTFSYSAWINPSSFPSTRGTILVTDAGPELAITNAGNVSLYNISSTNTLAITTTTPISLGTWSHVTVTYNSTTGVANIYVNGNLIKTNTSNPSQETMTFAAFKIGARSSNLRYFTGLIDDVRMYNRVLNTNEAKLLAQQYDPGIKLNTNTQGLAGWYKMDGNLKNAMPSDINCTSSGATLATNRKGKLASAYNFNGTSSYIDCGNNYNLIAGTTDRSLSAWIKTSGNSSVVMQKRDGGPSFEHGITINGSGKAVANFNYNTSYIFSATSTTSVNDGKWHQVTATFVRNGNMIIYVDGVAEASTSIASRYTFPMPSNNSFKIGRDSLAASGYFNGSIDDVRIYNRALTAGNIATLYRTADSQINLNAGGASGGSGINLTNGLVGEWNFNGNARDSTPYSNNGTPASGATLTTDRRNRANSAYSLASSYIQVPDAVSLRPATITISVWINPTDLSGGGSGAASIVSKASNLSSGYTLFYFPNQSRLAVDFGGGGNRMLPSSLYTPPLNTWTHLLYTYNVSSSPRAKLYVNGSLYYASNAGSAASAQTTANLRFGSNVSAGYGVYSGKLDDIRIYNRDLNANEVTALYNTYK